jgi:hypothetical protein
LLEEIILIDDNSYFKYLGQKLTDEIAKLKKKLPNENMVKLVRLQEELVNKIMKICLIDKKIESQSYKTRKFRIVTFGSYSPTL